MTRKEHLQKLPLQKRLQAMENIRRDLTQNQRLFESLSVEPFYPKTLLSGLFLFYAKRQKPEYWWCIQEKYFSNL